MDVSAAYSVLRLKPESSLDEAKKVFDARVIRLQPDRVGRSLRPAAESALVEVNSAWDVVRHHLEAGGGPVTYEPLRVVETFRTKSTTTPSVVGSSGMNAEPSVSIAIGHQGLQTKYAAGWYPQPGGERMYWDGQKYTANWVRGTAVSIDVSTQVLHAQLSQAQSQALSDGFPEKYVLSIAPMLEWLGKAVAAADNGDIVSEEHCVLWARSVAEEVGLMSRGKAKKWLEDQIQARTRAGELRQGVELVGSIGRSLGGHQASLQVFSDRLIHNDNCYALDADVRASVEVDGQVLQSTRPTMTRMALGSVLPGSALTVGLAAPKTVTNDTRKANFIVVHPKWRIVEHLDPNQAAATRGIAAQINAIAGSLSRQTFHSAGPSASRETPVVVAAPASVGISDQLDQLHRVAEMMASGALTEVQAERLRRRILGSEA